MRTADHSSLEGSLYNLSAQGCSIRLTYGTLEVDDEVLFTNDKTMPWRGKIRWVAGPNVGVEFEHPFIAADFELIAHSHHNTQLARAA